MKQWTKPELEALTASVQRGLASAKKGDNHDFYQKLYPQGASEADLADAVDSCPELHPQLVEIVERIIGLIPHVFSSIWYGPEEQAGSLITRALALYDRSYCALFARLLLEQDLLHEVHQSEYVDDILRKWGLCDETALVIRARRDNPGQEGRQVMEELMEEYGDELNRYLDALEEDDFSDDNEDSGLEPEDGPLGFTVSAQSKGNSRFLTLQWDEGGDVLVVSYYILKRKESRVRAFQYQSPQALQQTVEELERQCAAPHYTWAKGTNPPQVETIRQYGGVALEPPCSLMELFSTND